MKKFKKSLAALVAVLMFATVFSAISTQAAEVEMRVIPVDLYLTDSVEDTAITLRNEFDDESLKKLNYIEIVFSVGDKTRPYWIDMGFNRWRNQQSVAPFQIIDWSQVGWKEDSPGYSRGIFRLNLNNVDNYTGSPDVFENFSNMRITDADIQDFTPTFRLMFASWDRGDPDTEDPDDILEYHNDTILIEELRCYFSDIVIDPSSFDEDESSEDTSVGEHPRGDVNLDYKVDIKDAVLLLRFIANMSTLSPQAKELADYNEDTKVDIKDVVLLLRELI